jgi:hypothetical protein
MPFKSWNSFSEFARRVRGDQRFVRSVEDEAFLAEVLRTATSRITDVQAGHHLWRAQIGNDWQDDIREGQNMGSFPVPFTRSRMTPLRYRAKEGRLNPKGIPFLYLATNADTAMSEVRPWVGSTLSCGRFKILRNLKIVNCSVLHKKGFIFYFEEPDEAKREEAVWAEIDRAFSTPTVNEEDTADYVPTQVIAEHFKSAGFDGIAYKSALKETGFNVALFNLEDALLTECTLHSVESTQFKFEQAGNPFWYEEDGTRKTLSIEILGPAKTP